MAPSRSQNSKLHDMLMDAFNAVSKHFWCWCLELMTTARKPRPAWRRHNLSGQMSRILCRAWLQGSRGHHCRHICHTVWNLHKSFWDSRTCSTTCSKVCSGHCCPAPPPLYEAVHGEGYPRCTTPTFILSSFEAIRIIEQFCSTWEEIVCQSSQSLAAVWRTGKRLHALPLFSCGNTQEGHGIIQFPAAVEES